MGETPDAAVEEMRIKQNTAVGNSQANTSQDFILKTTVDFSWTPQK